MNYSLSFTCNNIPWLNHSNMGLFNKRDLKYLELSPAPQSSSWKQIVLCREKLLWSMCSMVCTVCQIKADTTKENCFRWTIRPDFTCSLTAVTQSSSVVMLSCVGRGVMVRAAWEWDFGEGTCSCQNTFSCLVVNGKWSYSRINFWPLVLELVLQKCKLLSLCELYKSLVILKSLSSEDHS